MYQSCESTVDQIEDDRRIAFLASIQSASDIDDKKPKKENIFSEFFSFLNVGFGVSNMDSIESGDLL
jgi:hypothetical protein